MAKRHPRLAALLMFYLPIALVSTLGWLCIDGPYDKYYGNGSKWGMVPAAIGETIPLPTLGPSPTPTAAEPVIPIIGEGGCNSDTPYFCDAEQLFLPSIMREESAMRGGSGITPVTK